MCKRSEYITESVQKQSQMELPLLGIFAFSGTLVGADDSVRPAKYASETRNPSANPKVPKGGQSRPPLRTVREADAFCGKIFPVQGMMREGFW